MLTKTMVSLSVAAVALGCIAAVPAVAGPDLTGTDITTSWLFPDSSSTYLTQTETVGPGVEISCAGSGVGTGLCPGFIDGATLDFGSNTINLTITSGTSSWNGAAFNGYEFSGLSAGGSWAGYSLVTDFAGLDTSRITFTPDAIWVNMQGITPVAGQSFTITLLSGRGVPEPAAWAMMIGGFGLAGAAMRRRRVDVTFAK